MAGKRSATSELTDDNWDKEEAPEEAGTFQRASDDSIKRRIIKTAKRRNPISSVRDGGDGEKKSAFTSFTGFNKAPAPTTAAFSFLSNMGTSKTPPKVNGIEGNSQKDKTDISTFKFSSNPVTSSVIQSEKSNEGILSWTLETEQKEKITTNIFSKNTTPNNNKDNNPSNSLPDKSSNYYSKLKGLNQSVSNWIKKHVDANPLINLQPIFRDYENYFAELEKEKNLKPPDTNDTTTGSFAVKPTTNVPDSTTEKNQSEKTVSKKSEEKTIPKFSFGSSVTSTELSTAKPSFGFGNKPSALSDNTPAFSFNTTTKEAAKVTNTTTPSFSFGAKPSTSTIVTTATSEPPKATNTTTPLFTFGVKPSSGSPTTKESSSSLFSFGAKSPSVSVNSEAAKTTSPAAPQVSFGIPSSTTEAAKTMPSFSFGTKTSSSNTLDASKDIKKTASTTMPSFSFGTLPSNSTIPPFSSSSPFAFSNVAKPVPSETKDAEEDEEPPKNEFTPVIEKDHIYTIRCKVFVKKDGKFGDRGVGNLFLKPVTDSEKVQLIVRADTNLGNLLVNLILSESIPTKRLGTKDVMLVCIPSPDMEPPPVPVLLRVKSSEEADQLLATLDKYKK